MRSSDQKLWPLSEARWAVRSARWFVEQRLPGLDEHMTRYLVWHLTQMYMTFEYMDNLHVAKVGDMIATYLYLESRKAGCCGRYDELVPFGEDLFLIGCNYGH